MNFCPDCGAAATTEPTRSATADAAAEPDRNRAPALDDTDRKRLEYRIARASREGWKLERDFGDRAVMVRRTFGSADEHLAVALVTVWFTMGIGNALWGAYRYVGDAERMVVGPDPVADDGNRASAAVGASETTDDSSRRWRAAAGGWWLLAALVALLGLELATATASPVLFALAALFASLGASALPSVRRRLEARHSVSANGRVRSIDERSVVAPERPCAACAEPIGRGLERTYRREYCVLGVPLTAEEGRNYYCRRCADGSTPATTGDDATSERESAAANRIGSGSRPNADLEDGREPRPDSRPAADAETESESTRG